VSYHLMVYLGLAFIAVTLLASWLLWRGTLFRTRWLLWVCVFAVVGAVAANQVGWVAAEVGRQPWIVQPPIVRDAAGAPLLDTDGFVQHGVVTATLADGSTRETLAGLRTTDGVSEAVRASQVLGSIVMFGAIYLLLGGLWVFVLNHKIQEGPEPVGRRVTSQDLPGAAGALAGHRGSLTSRRERGP